MSKLYDSIDERLTAFIEKQKMFFVATAPSGDEGHVNAHMILGLLATVETGLVALDIPHGAGGVTAAVAHLADGLRD